MRYFVLPYKQGSKSAKALAVALGGRVLKLQGSRYRPRDNDVIINWGNRDPMQGGGHPGGGIRHVTLLNEEIGVADKLVFFQAMADAEEDICPQWWASTAGTAAQAREEIPLDAYPIVCRTLLNAHSGAGIVIAKTPVELVDAPLYVKYIKKMHEYRIHVGNISGVGCYEIISVQQKKRKQGFDGPRQPEIRNLLNGYIYAREDVNPPPCVLDVAQMAFEASGLDFGAFDIIYNRLHDKAYVLEVNTAPGLEGQTVEDYARFFRETALLD